MDAAAIRSTVETLTPRLAAISADVRPVEIGAPATQDELDALESELGVALPPSVRSALGDLAGSVWWSWQLEDEELPHPFDEVFSGRLEWSAETIVAVHDVYRTWVEEVYPDPQDPYGIVWHNKLGIMSVHNGDIIAADLEPDRLGEIVYLSHDGGEGHGFVMARSLGDLVDRWLPLGCPGPEDWQWLPFVPFDLGPIDPGCEIAQAWQSLLGVRLPTPAVPRSVPDDSLFDRLVDEYAAEPDRVTARRTIERAFAVCSPARVDRVLGLVDADDSYVQDLAVRRLGAWRWRPAVEVLTQVALTGFHNARLSAIGALQGMPYPEAEQAIFYLRTQLDDGWEPHLRR